MPRNTITDAHAYLEAGLTVTEGLRPRKVIDALEDFYRCRRQSRSGWVPRCMSHTFPPGCAVEGLRWFYGVAY